MGMLTSIANTVEKQAKRKHKPSGKESLEQSLMLLTGSKPRKKKIT